jgi:hypothetical protein
MTHSYTLALLALLTLTATAQNIVLASPASSTVVSPVEKTAILESSEKVNR